jgi:hypothetical protein
MSPLPLKRSPLLFNTRRRSKGQYLVLSAIGLIGTIKVALECHEKSIPSDAAINGGAVGD